MRRIIYVIPYSSIIEQNAEVFRKILREINVIEQHSGAAFDSEDEINGTVKLMFQPAEEIFEGSKECRVKNRDGKPSWWWLRSPYSGNNSIFVFVFSSGAVGWNYADNSGGVAPGFCLIEPKKI